jgi:hypothetical protein
VAIAVIKELVTLPVLQLDKHLVLEILVNLIATAKQAMDGAAIFPQLNILRTTSRMRLAAYGWTLSISE